MKRTLLIARREYAAYARTVGFWLSLLSFPLFAVLGGAVPILIKSSEPVRAVAIVEEGPEAAGLAAAIQHSLREDQARAAERVAEARAEAEKAGGAAGALAAEDAFSRLSGPRLRIAPAPAELTAATPGAARDSVARGLLDEGSEGPGALDAVVLLEREGGKASARVWSRDAGDNEVEGFVREALKDANRREVYQAAGIDAGVIEAAEAFQPEVTALSPASASGGEISFRDQLPRIVGLASGFILWSLIITGASILLNSVMEEKSNKILEVLLSSASSTEILAGKVLGVAMLTGTVLLAWGGIGAAGLLASFPETALQIGSLLLEGGMIWYFIAYAAGGYLMYAVLFAAIGAFCETPRDAQTLMGPIMMVLVVPILVVTMAAETPDAPVVRILSWVPFFTPFLMSARAPSDPPPLEIAGTMAGMVLFALLTVWFAGRAFRAGALSDVKLSWKAFAAAMGAGR